MMRASIFTQQPLPTHLSTKDKAILMHRPFFHYITNFHLLPEKTENIHILQSIGN